MNKYKEPTNTGVLGLLIGASSSLVSVSVGVNYLLSQSPLIHPAINLSVSVTTGFLSACLFVYGVRRLAVSLRMKNRNKIDTQQIIQRHTGLITGDHFATINTRE